MLLLVGERIHRLVELSELDLQTISSFYHGFYCIHHIFKLEMLNECIETWVKRLDIFFIDGKAILKNMDFSAVCNSPYPNNIFIIDIFPYIMFKNLSKSVKLTKNKFLPYYLFHKLNCTAYIFKDGLSWVNWT